MISSAGDSGWIIEKGAASKLIAPEVVNALLAAGANPNLANNNGKTPFMAAASNSTEILQELLDHRAKINARDKDGETALSQTDYDDHEILDFLIVHGANVNSVNVHGDSVLVEALGHGDVKLVDYLYDKGAKLFFRSTKGNSLMIYLMKELEHDSYSQAVYWLVDHHIGDINKQNDAGLTPLMIAAYDGDSEVVGTLSRAGANPGLPKME